MSNTSMEVFQPAAFLRMCRVLQHRYTTLTTHVNEIQTSFDPNSTLQRSQLRTYLTEINNKQIEFELHFSRALNYEGNDAITDEELTNHQDKIVDMHNYLVSVIDILIGNIEEPQTTSSNVSNTSQVDKCVARLPKLDLIKFNGDFANWTTFINLFNTTIHHNSTISKVLKLQYLLSVLSGEPLNLIRNLPITEANYDIAYNILTERYQNDRRLQLLHINRIFDLPNITSKNIVGIRQFLNIYNENMQALSAIQCDIADSKHLLSALLLRKLDINLCKRLESTRDSTQLRSHTLPTVDDIINFLKQECSQHEDAVCSLETHSKETHKSSSWNRSNQRHGTGPKNVVASSSTLTSQTITCAVCGTNDHKTFACQKFLAKTPNDRYQLIKTQQHCVSCLGTHNVKLCQSKSLCKHCHKRHNTLLHFPTEPMNKLPTQSVTFHTKPNSSNATTTTLTESEKTVTLTTQHNNLSDRKSIMVLLGTVLLKLRTDAGVTHTLRALIDSGSMCSLITERAVALLNARRHSSNIQIMGINQRKSRNKGQIFSTIETLSGVTVAKDHPLIILDKLTITLPRSSVSPDIVQLTRSYHLADPTFHTPNRIDVILGAALFPQLLTGPRIQLGPDLPYLIDSPFGQVVMGVTPCTPLSSQFSQHSSTLNVCFHSVPTNNDLHTLIQKFWAQEEVPSHHVKPQDDVACELLFKTTHTRDETGRYTVRLPIKNTNATLGISRPAAEHRLHAMERKFDTQPQFAALYRDFMAEYIDLNHMTNRDEPISDTLHYYLPHHGILKESSSTTKLRTVFDASCKTSSGFSLNDILMTGSKLQSNIADIIMQFRKHNVVICCDIKQMYRQILIHPDDRHLQLIVWRFDSSDAIKTYELNTVTYGVNSSPYLAIRTLRQLALDEGHRFPNAANALLYDTYVDDIITGADSIRSAIELQTELQNLLSCGGFELRKWVSNSTQLLEQLPESHLETPKFITGSKDPHFTVLGLHWSPVTDNFTYHAPKFDTSSKCTKRTVLSNIASIYDPCGFLTPFVMLAKCLMQLIWTTGISWDTHLPPEILSHWSKLVSDTSCLSQINIPRSFNLKLSSKFELHGFCDASERGYAAVIYFRCPDIDQSFTTSLIIAKSRVAPLKRVSIPRLELCAAFLLSQLTTHVCKLFDRLINVNNIFLWSDSTITLNWINTPPYRLKTYVANRVAQIQECIPPDRWNHVSSNDNPADCASRGLPLSQLTQYKLWWEGPSWLKSSSSSWPSSDFVTLKSEDIPELKADPLPVFTAPTQEEWSLLTDYSSWFMLVRIMALILRFIRNCRSSTRTVGPISTSELHSAKLKLFSVVQQYHMQNEYQMLRRNQCPSRLSNLNPFIDTNNLIRVGGRLNKASIPFDVKHPVIMPQRHHVTNLIINHIHVTNLHAGAQYVQSVLVQSVWILNARNTIRAQLHKCVTCCRFRKVNTQPIMSNLPSVRTKPARPFASTGIDYAGPYHCKVVNLRFVKVIKVYISIFICMVTKAVHIEVVTDLTTDAFIAALTRFVSRRGICNDIYSDCGSNFVGADKLLKGILQSTIYDKTAQSKLNDFAIKSSIKFHFNPPAAPHFGGLWERAVQSIKYHLKRVMGNQVLTLFEFITLTNRIEAILNSRPLTPMSSDPNDFQVLTPGHFLIGAPLTAVPELDMTTIPINRLKNWQLTQKLSQLIWKKWSLDYLNTLQQRLKWKINTRNFKVGDLVLLKTSNNALEWPRARIIEIFPGDDNVVRTVKLQTNNGEYIRATNRLCLLPIEDC